MSNTMQLTYAAASQRISDWLGFAPDVSTVRRWIEKDGLVDRSAEAIDAYCLAKLGPEARRLILVGRQFQLEAGPEAFAEMLSAAEESP